jgi:lysophospholipase L1-like esterase
MIKRTIIIGHFVATYLLLILLIVKLQFLNGLYYDLTGIKIEDRQDLEHYNRMIKYHKSINDNMMGGEVIFIGDSLIQGLNTSSICIKAINYGIGGDNTSGLVKRIDIYTNINKAKAIIIEIGIHDILFGDINKAIMNIDKILFMLSPNSLIFLNAVFPVDENIEFYKNTNSKIHKFNKDVEILCGRYTNCQFLNPGLKLQDNKGDLSFKYHIGDGIHLNPVGYSIWINDITLALSKINKREVL